MHRAAAAAHCYLMILLTVLVIIIAVLTLTGILYQQIGAAIDRRRVLPPGNVVYTPGGRFHVNCKGEGEVTVILESGISASSLSWAKVQSEISKFGRVCSYDRAGLGWSDRRRGKRTPERLAQELHLMLNAAEIKPPYI